MKVLVVDDERRYLDYLGAGLERRGHEVALAKTGREAVDMGIRFRPQVLVCDWMLKNELHGIQVARALHAVEPAISTILISGFGSDDLRESARHARVYRFLEKPFELDTMLEAVERAGRAPRRRPGRVPFGVVVSDPEGGAIRHANARARELFERTESGAFPERLSELFGEATGRHVADSVQGWTLVRHRSSNRFRWLLRSRQSDVRVSVLLPERSRILRYDPRVLTLLDLGPDVPMPLPLESPVLVVDAERGAREAYVRELERVGVVGYAADSAEHGVRLLAGDPRIRVALVAHSGSGPPLDAALETLRSAREELQIVGMSHVLTDQVRFEAVGVPHFLHKPWRIGDLAELLEG